jgi:hypothetical protein
MNKELSSFAAQLREIISSEGQVLRVPNQKNRGSCNSPLRNFNELALELFALQFKHNSVYRKICEARKLTPQIVEHWTRIPFMPTSAFKELELTSLAPNERTAVFHSSGTTEQKPSRHFHNAESLELYGTSLWNWFEQNIFSNPGSGIQSPELICLAPSPKDAPHSSLVQMFEIVRQKMNAPEPVFAGKLGLDGAWNLNFDATLTVLSDNSKFKTQNPKLILGTAFLFVHLLDCLVENNLQLQLPENSRVLETGGYKNRSRSLPKAELHSLIAKFLGVQSENIICEYGMSELSSQAYATASGKFQFPSWAKAQIVSPETGREAADGETGLIRIFDLANVFSVAAIQTEDLGIRRGDGFELIGRAQLAEPRGCSLMAA